MTKEREALSFRDAVMRIGLRLDFARAAKVVFKTDRHVRNWSDPAKTTADLDSALALDIAYHRETGGQPPILAAYIHQFETESGTSACDGALQDMLLSMAREQSEAITASMDACSPGASPEKIRAALKELREAIDAASAMERRLVGELRSSVIPMGRRAAS